MGPIDRGVDGAAFIAQHEPQLDHSSAPANRGKVDLHLTRAILEHRVSALLADIEVRRAIRRVAVGHGRRTPRHVRILHDEIDLRDAALAVEVSHGNAVARDDRFARRKNLPVNRKGVIALQGGFRAAVVVGALCAGRAGQGHCQGDCRKNPFANGPAGVKGSATS